MVAYHKDADPIYMSGSTRRTIRLKETARLYPRSLRLIKGMRGNSDYQNDLPKWVLDEFPFKGSPGRYSWDRRVIW